MEAVLWMANLQTKGRLRNADIYRPRNTKFHSKFDVNGKFTQKVDGKYDVQVIGKFDD